MDRLGIGVLLAALVSMASCTLSREGSLPVTGGGGVGDVTSASGGGVGGTASGSAGAGGGGGTTGSCGLGFECVPEAALGQLVRRVTVPFGLCPTGWQDNGVFFDDVNPGCGSCSCDPPQGGMCQPGSVTRYVDGSCAIPKDGPTTSNDGSCVSVNENDATQARGYVVAPSTVNGTCEASTPAKPPVVQVVICRLEHPMAGGCPNGETCVPPGDGDTGDVCVLLEGSATCPGAYPQSTLMHASANDTRTCACSCGAPSGTCTGAQIELNDAWNCGSSMMTTVPADGNCANLSGATDHDGYQVEAGSFSGTGCPPSDDHSGDVTFTGPHTLCCP